MGFAKSIPEVYQNGKCDYFFEFDYSKPLQILRTTLRRWAQKG